MRDTDTCDDLAAHEFNISDYSVAT